MSPWDGIGLPPAVQARFERARSHIRVSLLSVPGQAGIGSAFQTVGDAMGCVVLSAEPMGKQECGFFSGVGNRHATPKVITSGSDRAPGGFASYVMARNFGWDTAIARMRAEA